MKNIKTFESFLNEGTMTIESIQAMFKNKEIKPNDYDKYINLAIGIITDNLSPQEKFNMFYDALGNSADAQDGGKWSNKNSYTSYYNKMSESELTEGRVIDEFFDGKETSINKNFSIFENPKTGETMLSFSSYRKAVDITDGMGNVNLVLTKDDVKELKKYLSK